MSVPWTAKILTIAVMGAIVGSALHHLLFSDYVYLCACILVTTIAISLLFLSVGAFNEWKHVDLPIYAVTNKKGHYIIHHVSFDDALRYFAFHREARQLVKTRSDNDLDFEVIEDKDKNKSKWIKDYWVRM